MKRPQVYRLLRIHERIKEGSYPNARSLAGELEVTERTVMRDLEFLRDRAAPPSPTTTGGGASTTRSRALRCLRCR